MKKIICILICLGMVLTLMGCSHLTEEGKVIAENAVEVTEQYLRGDISREDASAKLKYYDEQADAIPYPDDHDDMIAAFKLETFTWLLYMNISTYDTEDKIRENLRELKKLL